MSGAKGAPVIEVKDLNISFKTAAGVIKVVENVSFSIGKGECLAVVGESGSGKSVSALATIGLLVKDQSVVTGSVLFRGEELLGKPESYMRKIRGGGISMIFQEPLSALNPVTTIGEQIAEVLVAHGRAGWREANKKAIEYLDGDVSVDIRIPQLLNKIRVETIDGLGNPPNGKNLENPTDQLHRR